MKLSFHGWNGVLLKIFSFLSSQISQGNDENSNKGLMMTISLCFLNCVKEVEIVIPLDSQEAPTFCTERALKYTFFGC
jgi:hypothetical protein